MFLNNEPCWGSFQVCIGHLHVLSICFFMIFFVCVCICVWASTDYILCSPPFSTNGNICCCYSVTQSCLILYDPMDCSTPGFPVHHQLPEFTQTHVHWVGDAIQSSRPLSSPSPAFNLSQHQGLFKWVSSLHQVAKGLEFQLQHQSFQWLFRADFL